MALRYTNRIPSISRRENIVPMAAPFRPSSGKNQRPRMSTTFPMISNSNPIRVIYITIAGFENPSENCFTARKKIIGTLDSMMRKKKGAPRLCTASVWPSM
ncbi:hypothetical protein FQZ97_1211260 [compost metagenome]